MTFPDGPAGRILAPGRDLGRHPATTSAVGVANQNAIVEAIRAWGEVSKARIAELTGLSDPTVNRLLKTLIEQGYVEHAGVEASSGGRPPLTVRVAPLAILTGAIQAHSDRVIGALVGFDGAIIERIEYEVPTEGPNSGATTLQAMATELIRLASRKGKRLRGIGISLAAITDDGGAVGGFARGSWAEITADQLSGDGEVPVLLESDANVLAIGELYRGVGRDTRDFVTLVFDRGLGAGVVINGSLYRGARSAAGGIGYLLPGLEVGAQNVGSNAATASSAERVEPAEGKLEGLLAGIVALSSILDPQVIVLGEHPDVVSAELIPEIVERLSGRVQFMPEIRAATFGGEAVLLGAAEMALRESGGPVFSATPARQG